MRLMCCGCLLHPGHLIERLVVCTEIVQYRESRKPLLVAQLLLAPGRLPDMNVRVNEHASFILEVPRLRLCRWLTPRHAQTRLL